MDIFNNYSRIGSFSSFHSSNFPTFQISKFLDAPFNPATATLIGFVVRLLVARRGASVVGVEGVVGPRQKGCWSLPNCQIAILVGTGRRSTRTGGDRTEAICWRGVGESVGLWASRAKPCWMVHPLRNSLQDFCLQGVVVQPRATT